MIKIEEKDRCCGCYACYNACPVNAISMVEDEKGFKYPKVDEKKCINCGLCEKVCPILNKTEKNNNDVKAFAMYNKNEEERMKSSSGGVFSLIAKAILSEDGVVFGASFNEENEVVHIEVNSVDDLDKIRRSKYVQSKIGDTYKRAKKYLESGKKVLFTGTPCQINGLYSFLQKDYENLYTQDIICHRSSF